MLLWLVLCYILQCYTHCQHIKNLFAIDDPFFHSERGFGIGENIIFLLIVGLGAHIWTFYMETDSFRRFKIYLTKKTILPKICCCDKTVKVHVVEGDDLPEIDFGDQNNWEEEEDDDNMEYEIVLK